jgi:polar amino acid transport system substrate-binding protein
MMRTSAVQLPHLAGFLSLWAAWGIAFAAENVITLHYYERPPFHSRDANGQITGLVADPTIKILKMADVAFTWQLTPANRILSMLKNNVGMDCSPGWYKNPDRASYAQFSLPIYKDKPLVGLSRANFAVQEGITAKELLSRPGTRLLAKQNFSQGAYMDELIAKMPTAQVQRVAAEVATMVKMVQIDRADLILTTQEETATFIHQSGLDVKDFRVLKFPDVPAVENRYLLCSKTVPPHVITRMNKAIRELQRNPTRP